MSLYQYGQKWGLVAANLMRKLWASVTAPDSPATGEIYVDLSASPYLLKRYNGVTWDTIGAAASAGSYDIGISIAGRPYASEVVFLFVAVRAFTIPVSATDSLAKAGAASTGDVSFAMLKNGSSFGTVRFNASATGAFTVANSTAFAAGDILKVTAPAAIDTTLADISITLKPTI